MIGSKNALNAAYALYLRLRADDTMSEGEGKRIVRRWFVMQMLTGRHSGSFESAWEQDIRHIGAVGAATYLKQIEESDLTDGFWNVALPAALETTSTARPFFQVFLAAQVASGKRGFLSKSIAVAVAVAVMHQRSGDTHHIVPKDYLRNSGFPDRGDYNQVANFALTEMSINVVGTVPRAFRPTAELDRQAGGAHRWLGQALPAHARRAGRAALHHARAAPLPAQPPRVVQVDEAAIAAEARLDYKHLLRCSDPNLSAEDITRGYKQLFRGQAGANAREWTRGGKPGVLHFTALISRHGSRCAASPSQQ